MCGISGIINFDQDNHVKQSQLQRMVDALHHRGPDSNDIFLDANLGFGHNRLSIIDLDSGKQPMRSHCGNYIITFNGEIYNYLELKKELSLKGHSFQTDSDTEVILEAYKEWGEDCQSRLNGMWAFALWDFRKKRLFLSRDRIGEKPLFYFQNSEGFKFASELSGLFASGVPRNVDLDYLEVYLVFTYIPEPHTFYKDIFKLESGHYIIIENGRAEIHEYWDLPSFDEEEPITDKNLVYEKFNELFSDSIRLRMQSDVPFGAYLSGGLDSSSIVSKMADFSDLPISTFTIGFAEKAYDESKLAQLVAEKFNTNHHLGSVDPDNFAEILALTKQHFGEPFGDSSSIPTYYVSKFASESVKMVLTGDGGDEVLSGYNGFKGLEIITRLSAYPNVLKSSAAGLIRVINPLLRNELRYKANRAERILKHSMQSFENRLLLKQSYAPYERIKLLTQPLHGKCISGEDYVSYLMTRIPLKKDFNRLNYLNFKRQLPNDYLVKVDRMSMANSIETRTPFLDHRLIEFMFPVAEQIKMENGQLKSVLRKTVGRKLPNELLNAPKKGFGVPLREWFKSDDMLDKHVQLKNAKTVLETSEIDAIVSENKMGHADYGNFVWTLTSLNEHLK